MPSNSSSAPVQAEVLESEETLNDVPEMDQLVAEPQAERRLSPAEWLRISQQFGMPYF